MHPIQDCKRDPQWIEELGIEFLHKECIINGLQGKSFWKSVIQQSEVRSSEHSAGKNIKF